MKIVVPIKQVLDPNINSLSFEDSQTQGKAKVINPFCAIALEQAVQLKEAGLASEVLVVCISNASADKVIVKALASGADRAILIDVKSEDLLGPLEIAKLLLKLVKQEEPDLVLMGKQGVDFDNNQVGQMLSALLGWPQISCASKIELTSEAIIAERETDDGQQTLKANLPALITADLRLKEPRNANLAAVMKAKSKPFKKIALEHFDAIGKSSLETIELRPFKRDVSVRWLEGVDSFVKTIESNMP